MENQFQAYNAAPIRPPEPPKSIPWRDINFGQAISRAFKNYANFKGRASVKEYWWFIFFRAIVLSVSGSIILSTFIRIGSTAVTNSQQGLDDLMEFLESQGMDGYVNIQPNSVSDSLSGFLVIYSFFVIIFALVTAIPDLSVTVRRLHDTNRSGVLLVLLVVAPFFGSLIIYYLCAQNQVDEGNMYNEAVAFNEGVPQI